MAHKLLRSIHALVWPTSDSDVQDHQKKNCLSFGLKIFRLCLKPQTVLGNMKEIRQDVVKLEEVKT